VLVSVWEGSEARPEVERFREMWGIGATILLDESGDYARQLGIRGVPTNVLVDADGVVRDVGLVRLDELHAAVDRLTEGR
jgi:hypothetical protein